MPDGREYLRSVAAWCVVSVHSGLLDEITIVNTAHVKVFAASRRR